MLVFYFLNRHVGKINESSLAYLTGNSLALLSYTLISITTSSCNHRILYSVFHFIFKFVCYIFVPIHCWSVYFCFLLLQFCLFTRSTSDQTSSPGSYHKRPVSHMTVAALHSLTKTPSRTQKHKCYFYLQL